MLKQASMTSCIMLCRTCTLNCFLSPCLLRPVWWVVHLQWAVWACLRWVEWVCRLWVLVRCQHMGCLQWEATELGLHWLLKSIEGCQIFQFTQRQMRFDPKRNWFVGTVRSASLVVPVNILSVPWQFWRAKSLPEFELITGCYIYYDRIGSAAWLWLDPVELGIARLVPFV
jgi:hypothetical protein